MSYRFNIIASLAILSWVNGFAAPEIVDPKNLLHEVDQFVSGMSFSQSLACGTGARVATQSCGFECDAAGCNETCEKMQTATYSIVNCTRTQVTLRVSPEKGNIQDFLISRSAFELFQGNVLRFLLASEHDIENGTVISATLLKTSKKKFVLPGFGPISSMTLELKIRVKNDDNGDEWEMPVSVTVGKGLPGVAQLLETRMFPKDIKTPYFRVTELK